MHDKVHQFKELIVSIIVCTNTAQPILCTQKKTMHASTIVMYTVGQVGVIYWFSRNHRTWFEDQMIGSCSTDICDHIFG